MLLARGGSAGNGTLQKWGHRAEPGQSHRTLFHKIASRESGGSGALAARTAHASSFRGGGPATASNFLELPPTQQREQGSRFWTLSPLEFRGAQDQPRDHSQIHVLDRIIQFGLNHLGVFELSR